MLRFLFLIFICYILYKLIFDFIIPVSRTTKQVKQKFRDMQQMQEEVLRRQQQAQQQPPAAKPKSPKDDYIDFEEVKGS
jgi:energy-converting hydrogenase Eha subunit H